MAGLLLLPLEGALLDWLGRRTAAWDLADGLDLWMVLETALQIADQGGLLEMAGPWSIIILISLPAWPFVLSLPFALLSGGVLQVLSLSTATPGSVSQSSGETVRDANGPRGPSPTHWHRFWQGSRRYARPFTLLSLLETLLVEASLVFLAAILGLSLAVGGMVGMLAGAIVAIVFGVALVLAIPWWFGYARVIAVVEEERRVLRLLSRSASFLWKNLGPAAILDLLNVPLAWLLLLLHQLLALPIPQSWWIALFLLQQTHIFGRVGARVVRMSSELRLVQGRQEAPVPVLGQRTAEERI
jgi:hypothetical protein